MAEVMVSEVKELWRQNKGGDSAALAVLSLIFLWHLFYSFFLPRFRRTSSVSHPLSPSSFRISDLVTNDDLSNLIENLDEKGNETANGNWENVIEKRRSSLFYKAKCCKPKDGALTYLSVTVFENCSPETLRDFYMDCDYRKKWDRTVAAHEQLQVDKESGIEVGRTIKKFPLLTPREYVLAWKIWEGNNKTYYCFTKECEHASAPIQKKYVRVSYFRSGWKIRQVPGRNACEIKMVHQEDAGLNVEFAKLAFAKGIWSYVCKMDDALRQYSLIRNPQSSSMSAVTYIQKVPHELDVIIKAASSDLAPGSSSSNGIYGEVDGAVNERKMKMKPSKKLIANGLLLLGGLICLSHGHTGLGAKVAVAFVMKKLSKRGSSSNRNQKS